MKHKSIIMTIRTYLSQLQYEIYDTPDPSYMEVDEVKKNAFFIILFCQC